MYKDRSLVPTQARLTAALGFADAARRYGALAGLVRQFITRTVAPSIELLGPSIELLRLRGWSRPPAAPRSRPILSSPSPPPAAAPCAT
jgi:hypothetical protein